MTEIYSGALTCMYTMLWLKMPFVDINTQIFSAHFFCSALTYPIDNWYIIRPGAS